jgi:teichuronic acid biosynthesis glycosyltransferase TuaG
VIDGLVSIIMPAYNAEKYIKESIESVLAQTYKNWELIIIDDCSKDGTINIIKQYQIFDNRIRVICLKCNAGVANARNRGMELAKGRYIAFLDSDDLWLDIKLEEQIRFMQQKQIYFSFSKYRRFMDEKKGKVVNVPTYVNYQKALYGNPIGCLTVCLDRRFIREFKFSKQRHEDYIAWLNILKNNNICAYGIPKILALYRVGNSNSLSGNKLKSILWTWNVYRKSQKLSLFDCVFYMFYYVKNNILKILTERIDKI